MSIEKAFTSWRKTHNLKWYLLLKIRNFKIAVLATYYLRLFFCTLLMNKSLGSANLSLELHVVSTFCLGSDTSGTFSLYFAWPSFKHERPSLKMHILWCKTNICSCKLSAKASSMLDNPFPVQSLCKLNHICVCFLQISTKINSK